MTRATTTSPGALVEPVREPEPLEVPGPAGPSRARDGQRELVG